MVGLETEISSARSLTNARAWSPTRSSRGQLTKRKIHTLSVLCDPNSETTQKSDSGGGRSGLPPIRCRRLLSKRCDLLAQGFFRLSQATGIGLCWPSNTAKNLILERYRGRLSIHG